MRKGLHVICRAALFGLVVFFGGRACGQEVHDNVVIVLDSSGSMAESLSGSGVVKMIAAKRALKEVLQKVPESTHIGLLVFGSSGDSPDWFYPLGSRNNEELMSAIDRPEPHGGTPLGAYIKKGADRLLEERAKQYGYGSYRLLIVTDGQATDANLVERYTPEVIARGITMDVIGVGMKRDHTLATKVHSYRRADDPAALSRAIAEVFAEVGTSDSDVAGSEAFETIAPIPTESAMAIIQALSTSGNQPIGEQPRSPDSVQQSPSPRTGSTAIPQATHSQRTRGFPVGMIVLALVVIVVIRNLAKKGSRR